jgi:hypothetical protein
MQAARKIPIKGMTAPASDDDGSSGGGNYAPWREGQLFPEGWDSMTLPTKVHTHTSTAWRKCFQVGRGLEALLCLALVVP